jgi:hypothetical protein
MKLRALVLALPTIFVLASCGGGGSSTNDASSQPSPLLRVGMQRQYTGTSSRTVVYTAPAGNNQNNTLAYSFAQLQNVLQAPPNALGAFLIHTITSYNVTQDPATGSVPISQTVDDYRNLITNGNMQWTIDYGQTTTSLNSDEGALGNGPFTESTTTVASYPTPRQSFVYPLQTGSTLTVPQSSQQQITFTDLNASGTAPSNGSNVGYSNTKSQNDDGSFSFLRSFVSGTSDSYQQNADGSGSLVITTPNSTTTTNVGLPMPSLGGYSIPILRTVVSATPGTKSYLASDWYPGSALPITPLILQSQTVVGPVTTLPNQCSGAAAQPNMFEIDTTANNLSTITTGYSQTATRSFTSNGVAVCTLTQQTTYNYNLLTGALTSTSITQTNTILTSLVN